jgi:hypothetical protein
VQFVVERLFDEQDRTVQFIDVERIIGQAAVLFPAEVEFLVERSQDARIILAGDTYCWRVSDDTTSLARRYGRQSTPWRRRRRMDLGEDRSDRLVAHLASYQ